MSDTLKRDYISFLPYELLSDIFDKAYKDTPPPRSPISRAFLPFQRRALFHRVKISSSAQFESLIEAYEGNSRLGAMVKAFETDNTDSTGRKNDRRLKAFFSTLVNLEHLKLGAKCSSILELVLSLRIARSDLPRLKSLEIAISAEAKKPFDSKVYRHLDAYPALRRLEVSYEGQGTFSSSSRGGAPLAKIDELVLRGSQAFSSRTLSFISNFPNLSSLTLDPLSWPLVDYSSLVARLPVSLTSLTLRTWGYYDDFSKPCDQHLTRLSNLEYLYLGEAIYSKSLIGALRQLPKLKTLGFGRGVGLGIALLEELSIGPNALSSLEKLIFDQVEGKIGWRIEKDSDGMTLHPDSANTKWHIGPGWIMPKWSSIFPQSYEEHEMVALAERIRTKGVKVEGTTVEAFGVSEEYDNEIESCMIAHAYDTGDYEECREMLGDDFVEELLEDLMCEGFSCDDDWY
ncbi:hypothetical protein JCM16303_002714 [Sporobolomyces ruberrimus]